MIKTFQMGIAILIALILSGCDRDIFHQEIHAYIVPKDVCFDWAFGKNWEIKSIDLVDDCWNALHKDIFELKGTDDAEEAINRIRQECDNRKYVLDVRR